MPAKPFLSNPTSCGPFTATMSANSWEEPEALAGSQRGSRPDRRMRTRAVRTVDRSAADDALRGIPDRLEVSLVVPQTWENPDSIATANLKDTTVTLPEGYTINPSAGSGLVGVHAAAVRTRRPSSAAGRRLPAGIEDRLDRNRNAAARGKDRWRDLSSRNRMTTRSEPGHPAGRCWRCISSRRTPNGGSLIKVAGKIEPNPVTGQLVTTFDEHAAAAVQQVHAEVPPGRHRAAGQPPGVRDVHRQRGTDAVVGAERTAVCSQSSVPDRSTASTTAPAPPVASRRSNRR